MDKYFIYYFSNIPLISKWNFKVNGKTFQFQSYPWTHWQRSHNCWGRKGWGLTAGCSWESPLLGGASSWVVYWRCSHIVLTSVRRGRDLWFVVCLSVVVLVTIPCFFFTFITFALFLAALWYHLPLPPPSSPHWLSFVHFYALTFPFWSLYSLSLISLVVAASELTECFCHAVCLKPWYYCCRKDETWRGYWAVIYSLFLSLLHWLKGHCQGIFFIIFQIIFLTVYSNPLKAWNLNLSLPKVLSIIHSHWFVVVDLRLYVGLVPFEFLSSKAHVKSQVFCGGVGGQKGKV